MASFHRIVPCVVNLAVCNAFLVDVIYQELLCGLHIIAAHPECAVQLFLCK